MPKWVDADTIYFYSQVYPGELSALLRSCLPDYHCSLCGALVNDTTLHREWLEDE